MLRLYQTVIYVILWKEKDNFEKEWITNDFRIY